MRCFPTPHPGVKILAVLILSMALAWKVETFLPGVALLTCLVLICDMRQWQRLWRGVRRMRWLLLSIFLLHAFFTPGDPVWPALGAFSPSQPGLETGFYRGMMLLVMVVWAIWLMQDVAPFQVARALIFLLKPLSFVGFPTRRFALRLALTFVAVEQLETRARRLREEGLADGIPAGRMAMLRFRAELLLRLFLEADREAPKLLRADVEVTPLGRPVWWDGFFLFLLLSVLILGYVY